MIMCHLCNLNIIPIFLSSSYFLSFFLHIPCIRIAKNYRVQLTKSWCAPSICGKTWLLTQVLPWKGCICLPFPPIIPLFTHLCLKIALDLRVRFLFGLKSWTNYALRFHKLDRKLDSHIDTCFFFRLFLKTSVVAMLSTSYECRVCPGVVVDCKTFDFSFV